MRPVPSRATRSALASASVSVPTDRWRAPCPVIRPDSRLRLVTATVQVSPPGSRDVTWAVSAALSSTSSIRLSATRLRNSAA